MIDHLLKLRLPISADITVTRLNDHHLVSYCNSDATASTSNQISSQSCTLHHLSTLDILLGEDNSTESSRTGDHVTEIVKACFYHIM